MFLTVHGPVGALIGAATGNPILAFAYGAASHFALDIIPHGDEGMFERATPAASIRAIAIAAAIDGAVMLVVLAAFARIGVPFSRSVIAGIVGGVLPDVIGGCSDCFPRVPILGSYRTFHEFFHKGIIRYECSVTIGMVVQILTLATTLMLAVVTRG